MFSLIAAVNTQKSFATGEFEVSPMNQKISLVPGERTYGTFKITNPGTSTNDFAFELSIEPFTVDENYEIKFENNGDYNQIVDWITLDYKGGVISPNNTAIIGFYIDTPSDAPAGGQYASILVKTIQNEASAEDGINLHHNFSIAHVLYADVAGETVRKGTVNHIEVPSFLFSGQITGSASITNDGNVHSDGTYIMQIYPLFSSEELYTNEEAPLTNTILPGSTRSTAIRWDDTPLVGVFHVVYTASFEGVENKVDKIVIVCPLWLLFLIILAIFLLIFRIMTGKRKQDEKK